MYGWVSDQSAGSVTWWWKILTGEGWMDESCASIALIDETETKSSEDPGIPVSRYDTETTVLGPIRPWETGSKSSPLWDRTSNFVPIHTHCVYDLTTDESCPHCISNIKKFPIRTHSESVVTKASCPHHLKLFSPQKISIANEGGVIT
jgi:hypothetical protein